MSKKKRTIDEVFENYHNGYVLSRYGTYPNLVEVMSEDIDVLTSFADGVENAVTARIDELTKARDKALEDMDIQYASYLYQRLLEVNDIVKLIREKQ